MYCYWYVLNDYGIPIKTTLYILNEEGYMPKPTDQYLPNGRLLENGTFTPNGNTNYNIEEYKGTLNWEKQYRDSVDLRLFYTGKKPTDWARCRWEPDGEGVPTFYWKSPITKSQICYTPEALLYAQTAYLSVIVVTQWSNLLICKTRKLSLSQ